MSAQYPKCPRCAGTGREPKHPNERPEPEPCWRCHGDGLDMGTDRGLWPQRPERTED